MCCSSTDNSTVKGHLLPEYTDSTIQIEKDHDGGAHGCFPFSLRWYHWLKWMSNSSWVSQAHSGPYNMLSSLNQQLHHSHYIQRETELQVASLFFRTLHHSHHPLGLCVVCAKTITALPSAKSLWARQPFPVPCWAWNLLCLLFLELALSYFPPHVHQKWYFPKEKEKHISSLFCSTTYLAIPR